MQSESDRDNYTAMLFFLKGTTLLYAGQEFSCEHTPSLFEREVFPRNGRDISDYLRHLSDLKHTVLDADDAFEARADDEHEIAVLLRQNERKKKIGVFSLKSACARVKVDAPDGCYENLIDGTTVRVENSLLYCEGRPILFCFDR